MQSCLQYRNHLVVEKNAFSDNNITTQDNLLSDDDFNSLDGSQLMRARKTDGSLPDIDFLNLKSGSNLIDAGVDVGLPYYGKAPDIGAFEVVVGDYHLNKLPVVTISFPIKGSII